MHRLVIFLLPASAFATTAPVVPEPSTISMFIVAGVAGGLLVLRKRIRGK